ncbi:hypothetical protein BLOT_002078 [Blomia tropicalis]|nr:hypothetical protein BLOT_002078 [Blomia tropicalis]
MIIFKQRNSLTSQTKSNHQYVSVEEVNKYLPSLWIIISMIRSRPRAQNSRKSLKFDGTIIPPTTYPDEMISYIDAIQNL